MQLPAVGKTPGRRANQSADGTAPKIMEIVAHRAATKKAAAVKRAPTPAIQATNTATALVEEGIARGLRGSRETGGLVDQDDVCGTGRIRR